MENINFFKMNNVIQDYPWGSKSSITELFEIPNPEHKPMAEIWMGAHPKASSSITINNKSIPISHYVAENNEAVLGKEASTQFGELPYLFKVLAAAQALSIQVHPSKEDAQIGFDKENQTGTPLDAFNRNYKDPNHKPELVYALSSYLAMNGFRQYEQILRLFSKLNNSILQADVERYAEHCNADGLKDLFQRILGLAETEKEQAMSNLLFWAKNSDDELAKLVLKLNAVYPNDVGLFAPFMLNVILLQPGEAMFLDAGTPHAYLEGTALEIMANSDNVLRAGLTPKYIDVPELIASCRFEPLDGNTILTSPVTSGCEQRFPVPVNDFAFAIYTQPSHHSISQNRAEIWFAIDHDATFMAPDGGTLTISKGESVFIPFSTARFSVSSAGRVARAY